MNHCGNCKFWQGHKLCKWADCYRVIGEIEPRLYRCYYENDNVRFYWNIPFDPHEVKYWNYNDLFKKYYENIDELPAGFRWEAKPETDVLYTFKKGEHVGIHVLYYIQSRFDSCCDLWRGIKYEKIS